MGEVQDQPFQLSFDGSMTCRLLCLRRHIAPPFAARNHLPFRADGGEQVMSTALRCSSLKGSKDIAVPVRAPIGHRGRGVGLHRGHDFVLHGHANLWSRWHCRSP